MRAIELTRKERRIQEVLKDWEFTLQSIAQLETEIEDMEIGITPNYNLTGITAKGGISNKIERHYIQKAKKEAELREKKDIVDAIRKEMRCNRLTEVEKEAIRCLMFRRSLKFYASKLNIYKSQIYKIKDNAIRKVAKSMEKTTF